MSVCSSEVCDLSEKKMALRGLMTLDEDTNRASPVPFTKGELVSESLQTLAQQSHSQSENVVSSQSENVQITRKTKVEESFERSQKMYTAEISSSHSAVQVRASSPEMEQIMAKRRMYQAYDSPTQSPTPLQAHQKLQSERCLTPEVENLMDKPHGTWSPMPPACMVRPISPSQIVSFPPDMPPVPAHIPIPRTATPEQFQEAREMVERFVDHTKQVKAHSASTAKTTQSFSQQSTMSAYNNQYTPRFDSSQGFSPYNVRANTNSNGQSQNIYSGNGNFNGSINGNPGNHTNGSSYNEAGNPSHVESSGNRREEHPVNPNNGSCNNGNNSEKSGNPGNGYPQGNNPHYGNTGNGSSGNSKSNKEEEPTVTEPDETDEKHSRKSSRKPSFSEEESSRRVFSDFGGPQVSSSVDVESTTEEGIQKTSVKKTQKMQYSTCEFESTRSSTIKPLDENSALGSSHERESKPPSSEESSKYSHPQHSEAEPSAEEEEKFSKSQVEEIIKQELNKVFQMAQTMEKTNFGQMYGEKTFHAPSGDSHEHTRDHKASQKSSQSFKQNTTSSKISSGSDVITKTGKLTSGLTIAPKRTFKPQALEKNYPLPYQDLPSDFPLPRTVPQPYETSDKPAYVPLTGDRGSPFIQALTIAPDRPYSPLPIATAVETPAYITQPTRSSMLDALTIAPTDSFQIHGASSEGILDHSKTVHNVTESSYESFQKYSPKPNKVDFKPISSRDESTKSSNISKINALSISESERQQVEAAKQTLQSHLKSIERPITPSGLHAPNLLPYYQREIGEIPLAHRSNSPVPHQIMAPSITPPRAQSVPRQGEKGSVKALGEAYVQQVVSQNNLEQTSQSSKGSGSSVSYVSAGAFSKGSVTKTYSYEQEHKSIDAMGYHASPLAGKLPLAGEHNIPKCSSPVLGKLDHTRQMFKPQQSVPPQQPISVFKSPVAEQANLRQAPPYFVQEKDKPPVPWVAIKQKGDEDLANKTSIRPTPPTTLPSLQRSTPQTPIKPSLPLDSIMNKTRPAFPLPSSLPGVTKPPVAIPDAGPGAASKSTTAGTTAPRRGRGVLNAAVTGGARVPLCGSCNSQIRGPFITALGKIWCPEHFVCVNQNCRRPLQDIGFVEEGQGLYCEFCFEQYLAPSCSKCNAKVKGDCLNAIGKHFHPECFTCAYCGKLFGNSPFFLEDALPYCEADWNELFTTKCFSCGFPIEAGDRWVEALNNNYHSQCFNCTMCKKNLEGQSFFAKGGRPFCKTHAR